MECLLAMCNMKAAAASSFVIQPRGCRSDERETTRRRERMAPCANLIATFGHYCLALMHFWTIHRTDAADVSRFWGDFINFAYGMLVELHFFSVIPMQSMVPHTFYAIYKFKLWMILLLTKTDSMMLYLHFVFTSKSLLKRSVHVNI